MWYAAHRAEGRRCRSLYSKGHPCVACPPDGFVVGEGDERSCRRLRAEKRRGDAVHGGIGDCAGTASWDSDRRRSRPSSDRSVVESSARSPRWRSRRCRCRRPELCTGNLRYRFVPEPLAYPGLLRVYFADRRFRRRVSRRWCPPSRSCPRSTSTADVLRRSTVSGPRRRGHDRARVMDAPSPGSTSSGSVVACGERVALVVNGERGKCPEVHGDRLVRRGVARYRGGCALEGAGGDGDRCLPLPERHRSSP